MSFVSFLNYYFLIEMQHCKKSFSRFEVTSLNYRLRYVVRGERSQWGSHTLLVLMAYFIDPIHLTEKGARKAASCDMPKVTSMHAH